MSRFAVDDLRQALTSGLESAGVPDRDARLTASCLLDAETGGQSSHGLLRYPVLLQRVRSGHIEARPHLTVRGHGAVRLLDAGNALGQVAGMRAMDLASDLAREHGTGLVAVRASNHLGALDVYVRRASAAGLIGVALSNTPPAMAPPGSGTPYLGTNPIGAAFPTRAEPVVVDMGTSQAARGRVVAAQRARRSIPVGWAVDGDGAPTTDPAQAIAGSMVPMGGDKGFALALVVELLSAGLAGAAVGPAVGDRERGPTNFGHAFWVTDPGAVTDGFQDRAQAVTQDLHQLGARVPGERRARARDRAQAEGVEVSDQLRGELEEVLGRPLQGGPP